MANEKDVKATQASASQVEIITDDQIKPDEQPLVSIKTGQTENKTIYFRINQPKGRALLIAVHL